MKKLALLIPLAFIACGRHFKSPAAAAATAAVVSGPFTAAEARAFAALEPIDTHSHVYAANPAFNSMLARLHLHLLTICLYDNRDPFLKNLQHEIIAARRFVASDPGHAAWCTSFNPFRYGHPGFAARAARLINRDFAHGAIAVKIWKNVGMELKNSRGQYVMPDDPAFEPIFRDIAARHKTLVAHLAEPDSCWKPLDPASPDYWYYTHNPVWYMYKRPGAPAKAEILRARDHLVAENPRLRVVGAHFGSLESNFPQLGRRLDRYPNFAVDMAARMPYVMMLPRQEAIAFIEKYQHRLLYGTDLGFMSGDNPQPVIQRWESNDARDWRFLATDDWVSYRGKKYQGLGLPPRVLANIYHNNAVRWFPGILGAKP